MKVRTYKVVTVNFKRGFIQTTPYGNHHLDLNECHNTWQLDDLKDLQEALATYIPEIEKGDES